MHAIWTLAIKDLRLLIRDRFSLFWVLAFPLLLALFFGSMYSTGSGDRAAMKIVVVDDSGGKASQFVERLSESAAMEVDSVESLDDARDLVRRGARVAFVHIRPGFSDGGFAMFAGGSSDGALIGLGVDPARSAERGMLQGLVTQALFAGTMEQMTNPTQMREQTDRIREQLSTDLPAGSQQRQSLSALMDALDQVSEISTPRGDATEPSASAPAMGEGLVEAVDIDRDRSGRPRSGYEITFPSSMVWGLMGCATAFATTLVRERRAGTLLRLHVSPLSRAHVLAGKGLACILAGLGASTLLLLMGMLFLGVRVGNPALLVVALLAASLCFTGLMLVMSVIGRTEAAVAGGSWVIMMPLAMIGGGMIPLIAMPPWLLAASDFSPFKWAIYAIEGAVWRDFSLAELLPSVGILVGIAAALFGVGIVVLRRRSL
ncbi:MAG: ABC transporter permease [Myxococcota bacterium]